MCPYCDESLGVNRVVWTCVSIPTTKYSLIYVATILDASGQTCSYGTKLILMVQANG